MYLTEKTIYENRPSWVSSHHYINRTRTATRDMATEEDGKMLLKAGTVFPANTGSAEGIVFHDVDLTHAESLPVAVMVEGYVYESRLPNGVSTTAKGALNGITFEEYNSEEVEEGTDDGEGEA